MYHTVIHVCHNTPGAGRIDTNSLVADRDTPGTEGNDQTHKSPMQTEDVYTADTRSLLTVPVLLTEGDCRRKVDTTTVKQCTGADIAAELERPYNSENIVGDRNCVLHQREQLSHLIGAKEQEMSQVPTEGNYIA